MSEQTETTEDLKSIEVSSLTELKKGVVYFVTLPPGSLLENVQEFQTQFRKHGLKGIFTVGQLGITTLKDMFEKCDNEQKQILLDSLQPTIQAADEKATDSQP